MLGLMMLLLRVRRSGTVGLEFKCDVGPHWPRHPRRLSTSVVSHRDRPNGHLAITRAASPT